MARTSNKCCLKPEAPRRQGVFPVPSQWYTKALIRHLFAEGSRRPLDRVEVCCRREQQNITGNESGRRGARRGIRLGSCEDRVSNY